MRMKKLGLGLLVLVALHPKTAPAREWVYGRVLQKTLTPAWVARHDFIRDHVVDDTYAFGYVKSNDVPRHGFDRLDAWTWATRRHDPKSLREIAEVESPSTFPREDFHTYSTLSAELKSLVAEYPAIAKLHSAGKSVEGRDLWYVEISGSPDANAPKLALISSMHGDEVTGKEMLVYLTRELLRKYATDARIRSLVDHSRLFLMPSMNPDGTERKSRFNAKGVDLNRDFPDPGEGDSDANRAQETKLLMKLFREHHFLLALNYHGGALVVNIPWDHKANPKSALFGDDEIIRTLAREYADTNIPMSMSGGGSFDHGVTYGYEWYQVLGGMQDYSIWYHQSIHATVEVSDLKWPSSAKLPQFWKDNRDAFLQFLERGQHGVHLRVTDEAGNPVPVEVEVSSSPRRLRYAGWVHRVTLPGPQTVTLRAEGKKTEVVEVTPSAFRGVYQHVVMH